LEDNDGVGLLHEWAFENTGAAIQVAAVPESGAALLGGLGVILLLRRRR
jgi:MYXO-CTERM domain-containing protein